MTNPDTDFVRLRVRGIALEMAWDKQSQSHTLEKLNDEIAMLQKRAEGKAPNVGERTDLYGVECGLEKLSKLVEMQHAMLMLLAASKGSETEKVLAKIAAMFQKVMGPTRPQPTKPEPKLSALLDHVRQREFEEQRSLEQDAVEKVSEPPRENAREIG